MHSVKASEVGRRKGAVTFAGGDLGFADKKCELCFCSVGLKSVSSSSSSSRSSNRTWRRKKRLSIGKPQFKNRNFVTERGGGPQGRFGVFLSLKFIILRSESLNRVP